MTSTDSEKNDFGDRFPDARPSAEARPAKVLRAAAKRALEEAEARRQQAKADMPREIGGRGGPDPARYGDWEIKGRATDF